MKTPEQKLLELEQTIRQQNRKLSELLRKLAVLERENNRRRDEIQQLAQSLRKHG